MIAGRYTLDREVGRGGMGAVWLGRDEVLGRQVALKRIGMAPGAHAPDLARAEREARLAARLNHPHVVAVFDLVVDDGQQWLVMEYVENVTLSQLVARDGALPPERAAFLVGQAADALAAAHAAGIVHRDVKPSNILVTGSGQVKLSDFGIARTQADTTLTQTGMVTGSPAYLAPEVAAGQMATAASDVWSLGATLFHALAGHPPYEVGENLLGTLYRIVHEEPPRLDDAGWLAPLLAATMTREPSQRWSMAEARDFLRSGGAPTQVPPAGASPVSATPDPARTQVLAPVPSPTPTPTEPAAAAPTAASTPAPQPAQRRRGLVPLVAAVVVLLVLAVAAWAVLRVTDEPAGGPASAPDRSGSPSAGQSSSQSPSQSGSQSAGPTAPEMESFIDDYLSTVTRDPEAAFAMLTPGFQEASGGVEGYRGFWDTIRSARAVSFHGTDPEALTVGYTVDYVRKDGSRVRDDVNLQLAYDDGSYLIAGEA